MSDASDQADVRDVLTELSTGRITVDEAHRRINRAYDRMAARRPAPLAGKPGKSGVGAGLFMLLIGFLFGGVGGFFGYKTLDFTYDSARVEGTVVRLERSGNKGNRIPVVRYEVGGKAHELRGDIGTNSPPALNSKVGVIYKTADPSRAQLDTFVERWLFPLIFGGIGGLLALAGFGLIIAAIAARIRAAAGSHDRFTV